MTITETAMELAAEDGLAMFKILGINMKSMPVIHPGTDFVDGHIYMTIPTPRTKTVKGKGKDADPIELEERVTVSIRDDGRVHQYDEQTMMKAGYGWPATFAQQRESRWPLSSIGEWLAPGGKTAIDSAALYQKLHAVYMEHVEFAEPLHYEIMPLYMLYTYVFTVFGTTPYLHFNGQRASGKTQNLNILSALGFNTVMASNMSASALFRQVAGWPGILAIDEAEDFSTEKGQEIRQILNSGYKRGSQVLRSEPMGESWQTVPYDVFCPKVIASINVLDPTLASRTVTIQMKKAIRTIPAFHPEDDQWTALRCEMYAWAMQHGATLAKLARLWSNVPEALGTSLGNREWEMAGPLLTMAEYVNGREQVLRLVPLFEHEAADKIKAEESINKQVTLLKSLPGVMRTGALEECWYKVSTIHDAALEYLDADQHDYYKTKTVRAHLAALGFKTTRTKRGGPQVWLEEDALRDTFRRNRIEPLPEDLAWSRGEESYAHVIPPERPPAIALWAEPDPAEVDEFGFLEETN